MLGAWRHMTIMLNAKAFVINGLWITRPESLASGALLRCSVPWMADPGRHREFELGIGRTLRVSGRQVKRRCTYNVEGQHRAPETESAVERLQGSIW